MRTDDVREPREFHEPFTRTDSWILRSQKLLLEEAGKYYVVAFSSHKDHGKLWLSVGQRESFGVADFFKFPSWTKTIRAFHELDSKTDEEVTEAGLAEQDLDGILDLLAEIGRFSVLLKAIDMAGMSAVLDQDGPFTVFAPTDAAFGKLPDGFLDELMNPANRQQLKDLLQHHVLEGRIFLSHKVLDTLAGDSMQVQLPGFIFVGGVKVLHPDISASNGIVHVVEGVLAPGTNHGKWARNDAKALIETTITQGTSLFNNERVSDCVAIYASTMRVLKSILSDNDSEAMKEEIARALEEVLKMRDQREQAWRYQEILDDIYSRVQDVSND